MSMMLTKVLHIAYSRCYRMPSIAMPRLILYTVAGVGSPKCGVVVDIPHLVLRS